MLYPLSTLCRLWVLVSKVAWPLTSKGVLLARPPLALSCFAACLSKYLKMCVRPRMHNCEKKRKRGKKLIDNSITRSISIAFHRESVCAHRGRWRGQRVIGQPKIDQTLHFPHLVRKHGYSIAADIQLHESQVRQFCERRTIHFFHHYEFQFSFYPMIFNESRED